MWIPNLGELDQIDVLPNGNFVLAHYGNGTIIQIGPDGGTETLASDQFAYGVRVGPDGRIYTANTQHIYRIDPMTGEQGVWLAVNAFKPRVIDFSPTADKLYIGSQESGGGVWQVDLDDQFEPVGSPELLVDNIGDWHDGLGVDVCGNIYLAEYETKALYRISADGTEVITLIQATSSDGMLPHGLAWGSGIGGWREDALYLPQPMNGDTIAEAVIGVPYRTWTGPVINAQ